MNRHSTNPTTVVTISTQGNLENQNNEPTGPFAKAGGLIAFCAALYSCIVYVKPFWDKQKGINNDGAIALTVLTAIVGISSVTGMGAAVGNWIDKIFGSSSDTNRLPTQEIHIHHYHDGNGSDMLFFPTQQTVRAVALTTNEVDDVESNKRSAVASVPMRHK